jgi:hypothetical protein
MVKCGVHFEVRIKYYLDEFRLQWVNAFCNIYTYFGETIFSDYIMRKVFTVPTTLTKSMAPEPAGSSPYPQEPATDPYPESTGSIPPPNQSP